MKRAAGKLFSHFDGEGNARMVSISSKPETEREAVAAGSIRMAPAAYQLVKAGNVSKGDVLGVARIAGIMAAKRVDVLIPLAHPLLLNEVAVSFSFDDANWTIGIESKVCSFGKTGVEMEALTAVSIAALTIYDMCKSVDKGMVISNIQLLVKTGGKSGRYAATAG